VHVDSEDSRIDPVNLVEDAGEALVNTPKIDSAWALI